MTRVVSCSHPDLYTKPTDAWCHWCSHGFDNIPLGLPIRYNESKCKFVLSGIYCSYACVLAANKDRNDARVTERSMWTRMLAKKWHGIPMRGTMRVAPDRRVLRVFGGTMCIKEFRGCVEELIMQDPPIIEITPEQALILSRLREPQRVPALRKKPIEKKGGRTYKIPKPAPKTQNHNMLGIQVEVEK